VDSRHELPTPQREASTRGKNIVAPPEAPRRKHKLKPQITGPTLFGDTDTEAEAG